MSASCALVEYLSKARGSDGNFKLNMHRLDEVHDVDSNPLIFLYQLYKVYFEDEAESPLYEIAQQAKQRIIIFSKNMAAETERMASIPKIILKSFNDSFNLASIHQSSVRIPYALVSAKSAPTIRRLRGTYDVSCTACRWIGDSAVVCALVDGLKPSYDCSIICSLCGSACRYQLNARKSDGDVCLPSSVLTLSIPVERNILISLQVTEVDTQTGVGDLVGLVAIPTAPALTAAEKRKRRKLFQSAVKIETTASEKSQFTAVGFSPCQFPSVDDECSRLKLLQLSWRAQNHNNALERLLLLDALELMDMDAALTLALFRISCEASIIQHQSPPEVAKAVKSVLTSCLGDEFVEFVSGDLRPLHGLVFANEVDALTDFLDSTVQSINKDKTLVVFYNFSTVASFAALLMARPQSIIVMTITNQSSMASTGALLSDLFTRMSSLIQKLQATIWVVIPFIWEVASTKMTDSLRLTLAPSILVNFDPAVLDFFTFTQFCVLQMKDVLSLPWITESSDPKQVIKEDVTVQDETSIDTIFFPILNSMKEQLVRSLATLTAILSFRRTSITPPGEPFKEEAILGLRLLTFCQPSFWKLFGQSDFVPFSMSAEDCAGYFDRAD